MAQGAYLFSTANDGLIHARAYPLSLVSYASYFNNHTILNALGAWAGFTSGGLVQTTGSLLPNFVAGSGPDGAIVCFAGTDHPSQIAAYLTMSVNVPASDSQLGGRVCAWIDLFFNELKSGVEAFLQSLPSGHPVIFCGHSLGGAMAQMFAHWAKKKKGYNVCGCWTFGKNRWCAGEIASEIKDFGLFDFRCFGDPIPSLPPAHGQPFNKLNVFLTIFCDYAHPAPGIYIDEDGKGFTHSWDRWSDGLLVWAGYYVNDPFAVGVTTSGTRVPAFASDGLRFHDINTYCTRLQTVARRRHGVPGMPTLDAVFNAIALYADKIQKGELPPDSPQLINALNFADPDIVVPPAPGTPPIPLPAAAPVPEQIARTTVRLFEPQGGTTNFTTDVRANTQPSGVGELGAYPGNDLGTGESNFFRGDDRRIMLKAYDSIVALMRRDSIAANPAPSRAISTRTLMFSPDDAANFLALSEVQARLGDLLSIVNTKSV